MAHSRGLASLGLVGAASVALWRARPEVGGARSAWHDPQRWVDTVGPDRAALALLAVLCWLAMAWAAAGLAVIAATTLPGQAGRWADRAAAVVVPSTARRIASVAVGMSLTASAGAAAADDGTGGTRPAAPGPATGVDWPVGTSQGSPPAGPSAGPHCRVDWPLDLPSDAVAKPRSRSAAGLDATPTPLAPLGPGSRPDGGVVVVHPGDSLWAIAAHRLGTAATAGEIEAESLRWFTANRAVLRDGPDVLTPGQRLTPPQAPPPPPPRVVLPPYPRGPR